MEYSKEFNDSINQYSIVVSRMIKEKFENYIKTNINFILSSKKPISTYIKLVHYLIKELVFSIKLLNEKELDKLVKINSKIGGSSFKGNLYGGFSAAIYVSCYLNILSFSLEKKFGFKIQTTKIMRFLSMSDLFLDDFPKFLGFEANRNEKKDIIEISSFNIKPPFLNKETFKSNIKRGGGCPAGKQNPPIIFDTLNSEIFNIYSNLIYPLIKEKANLENIDNDEKNIMFCNIEVKDLENNKWLSK